MNGLWMWLKFAWHNCLRNRRRSLVTAFIAMLGTAAILLAGGFALFTYESLAQAAARDTGHLVLGTPAHFSADEDMPLQHGLDDVAALRKTSADAHVVETTALNAQIADMQATISAKDDTIREKDAEITRITAEKDAAVEVAGSALVEGGGYT